MGKILLFTLEYPPFYGGVANYYGNLVKYYPKTGNVFVLHNNDGKLINNRLPLLKWLPSVWHLWKTIKKENISYILVGHILPLGTATYLLTKFINIKYSVILHGMDLTFALKTGRKRKMAKKILEAADNIICANSYTAKKTQEFIGAKISCKIIIVNPGISPRKQDTLTSSARGSKKARKQNLINKYNLHGKIVLFSVGRLVKRKGFDKVIEAMPKALKEAPNLVYVIAGEGPDENYLKTINSKGDIPNTTFIGRVSEEEKWAWLKLSDVFIMPARDIDGDFEGFGIVYLEANLAGRPVIAGRSGGVGDAVKDGLNGLLVNPESVDAVAQAIVKLAKDENLRQKLGEQGKEMVIEKFNWEKQINKIYKIII